MEPWENALHRAIIDATIHVVGDSNIQVEGQALTGIALMRAYGDSPTGFIYFEPMTSFSSHRSPDVVLCHPEVGLLVIEVKSIEIQSIRRIEAGNISLLRNGHEKTENPIRQAQAQMFDIKNAVSRIAGRDHNGIIFLAMAAFPMITHAAWMDYGYGETMPEMELLFRDHFLDTQRLKQRIEQLVKINLQRTGYSQPLNEGSVSLIKRAFGDSSIIHERRAPRQQLDPKSLGAFIDTNEAREKRLSEEQERLSKLPIEGYPRLLRGVAGSGKTIVLAQQVAKYIHACIRQPMDMFTTAAQRKPRVGVICFNRALIELLEQRIMAVYEQLDSQTLSSDDAQIDVVHFNGLFYRLKQEGVLPISYMSVETMPDQAERSNYYLGEIERIRSENPQVYETALYDVIFVDEGQDLEGEDYKVLSALVRTDEKTGEKPLIIYYDDAQNIYARQRPVWKELGLDVARGNRSQVMKTCHRNTRQVVELAFNVLIGVQATSRVMNRMYAEVAELKKQGLIEELGDHVRVRFAKEEFHRAAIRRFATRDDEKTFAAQEIVKLIEKAAVRPEDLLVLFHNKWEFDDLADRIKSFSTTDAIEGFILPYRKTKYKSDRDHFLFRAGHLTISNVHQIKGYDAPIVFMVGVDEFKTDEEGRALFYVGATRAKLLLYLSGVDKGEPTLLTEAEKVNAML